MGIDLRLLVFVDGSLAASFTQLDLERDYGLWNAVQDIEEAHGQTVPPDFRSFSGYNQRIQDTAYDLTTMTPYGDPLRYVLAEHLKPLASHPANQYNRAAWAYIAELPDDRRIALYWH